MSVRILEYEVQHKAGGSWTPIDDSAVLGVDAQATMSGQGESPLAFGTGESGGAIRITRAALYSPWEYTPVRVSYLVNSIFAYSLSGPTIAQSTDGASVELRIGGWAERIRTTRVYSPMFQRRPIATKTTGSSVEDPSSPSYQAGPLNYLFWQAGGRPAAQDFAYPSAVFYYSCDQALIAPDWTWLAGEDGWAEAQKLVEASGGLIYQTLDGVVTYRNPLLLIGTATATFDESVYAEIQESTALGQYATKVTCPYVPRLARPLQEVISDTTPRLVTGGGSVTIELEPQWPLKSVALSGSSLPADALVATFLDGAPVTQGASGYTHTVAVAAQKVTIVITNATTKPFTIWKIALKGEPVVAGEAGTVSDGGGDIVRTIGENPFIQRRAQAAQLAALYRGFYGTARPVRALGGCPYDAARTLGETVALTSGDLGLSASTHLTLAIRHRDVGGESEYDLVPVTGLPTRDSFFVVGGAYAGVTKQMGY